MCVCVFKTKQFLLYTVFSNSNVLQRFMRILFDTCIFFIELETMNKLKTEIDEVRKHIWHNIFFSLFTLYANRYSLNLNYFGNQFKIKFFQK